MKSRVEIAHGTGFKSIREFTDPRTAEKWARAEVQDADSPLYKKRIRVVSTKDKTAEPFLPMGEDDVSPYVDVPPELDTPKAEEPPTVLNVPPVHPLVPAILELRYLSMVSQQLHWTIAGPTAPADHKLMRKLYEVANDAFDTLAERAQGLPGLSPPTVDQQAAYVLSKTAVPSTTMVDVYHCLLGAVATLNAVCVSDLTPGTANLVQGIADKLEEQAYFVGQRTR